MTVMIKNLCDRVDALEKYMEASRATQGDEYTMDRFIGLAMKQDVKLAERDALLRELQWSSIYSYCTGWNCCPICNGIQPPQGILNGELPTNSGHRPDCKIRKVLGEVDDE